MHGSITHPMVAKIWAIDLDPIKIKLMDPLEGKGWDRQTVERHVEEYRRFLFLSVTEPGPIVPSCDVDAVWHAHILDTRKYAEDCTQTFGYFLHHFPYFGLRGEEDRRNLHNAFANTRSTYLARFGGALQSESADAAQCSPSGCVSGNCAVSPNDLHLTASQCSPSGCESGNCAVSPDDVRRDALRSYERPTFNMMAAAA